MAGTPAVLHQGLPPPTWLMARAALVGAGPAATPGNRRCRPLVAAVSSSRSKAAGCASSGRQQPASGHPVIRGEGAQRSSSINPMARGSRSVCAGTTRRRGRRVVLLLKDPPVYYRPKTEGTVCVPGTSSGFGARDAPRTIQGGPRHPRAAQDCKPIQPRLRGSGDPVPSDRPTASPRDGSLAGCHLQLPLFITR
jgi:hypothetical protein